MSSFDDFKNKGCSDITPKPQVLGFGGSPRKGGNSDVLLKQILKGVTESRTTATKIALHDYQY